MRKKVLICSSFYYPEKGAAPHRITTMAEMLDCDVTVLTPFPNYPTGKFFEKKGNWGIKESSINDVKIIRYWILPTNSNLVLLRLISIIISAFSVFIASLYHLLSNRSYSYAIIQTPPLISAFAYQLSCKLFRVKTIVNVSDIWPSTAVDMGAMLEDSGAWRVFRWCERFLYENGSAFISQSKETQAYLEQSTDMPVHLFRNLSPSTKIPKRIHEYGDRIQIVYAGLLGSAQGLLSLIKNLEWDLSNAELHIYGDGVEREAIRRLSKKNVFLHDPIPKELMQEVLAKYDFSLVTLREKIFGAFPSKISASVASRVPIIFLGSGEGASVVEEYELGVAFEVDEISALKNFLSYYAANRQLLREKYKYNLSTAISNEFNYERNNEGLKVFLNKF